MNSQYCKKCNTPLIVESRVFVELTETVLPAVQISTPMYRVVRICPRRRGTLWWLGAGHDRIVSTEEV